MDPGLITVEGVEKRFSAVTAVDGMTFQVQAGEIFALLGPNGAGKSTLLRMLLGLIHPDVGTIAYHLSDRPERVPDRGEIGYLPEDRGLYQDVAVLRTLMYFGVLRGMSRTAARDAAGTWLERMNLSARADEPLKALSKGNQQKIQFVSAVLHRPRVAVLDEPFSGLDPLNQELFLDLLGELRADGTTVLLSAHQMNLVERIADRLIVMSRGRTVLSGTIPAIRRKWTTGSRILLRVNGASDLEFVRKHSPDATARVTSPGEIELFVRDGTPLGPLLSDAGAHLDIREIETHAVTLHDVYVGSIAADDAAGAEAVAQGAISNGGS
jgi:ABC-2 type transport system ATP-binding protein